MGRRSKFIRDVLRKRDSPRDKNLHSFEFYYRQSFRNLYNKIKSGGVTLSDLSVLNQRRDQSLRTDVSDQLGRGLKVGANPTPTIKGDE